MGRDWAERLHREGAGVPYGIALAAAALLVYPQTEWMTAIGLLSRPLREEPRAPYQRNINAI